MSGDIRTGTPFPGGGLDSPGSRSHALQPLSIDDLRHPTEASRFALALVASAVALAVAVFVLVSLGRATLLWVALLVILIILGTIWILLQVGRVSMLADAVKVSADTLPEVQEILDAVAKRLDYRRRIDMFVVNKMDPPVTLASLFGVRVLLAEGGALGDLADDGDRRRLMFLLATYVGALRARHTRWGPFLLALDVTGLTKVVYPFVLPWFRATVYTGDRIAYACLGDLDVSLQAVYKTLVGKDVASHVRAPGFASQALVVRRRTLLRLSQLQRAVPHATNRYLDLLAFASGRSEEAAETVRNITASSPSGVENILNRLRRRHPSVAAIPLAALLAGTLVLAGLIAGLQFRNSPVAVAIDNVWTELNSSPSPTTDASSLPTVMPTSEPASPTYISPSPTYSTPMPYSPSPTESASSVQTLLEMVPADVVNYCSESGTGSKGELASLICETNTTNRPNRVTYTLFNGNASLESAFDDYVGVAENGSCTKDWNVRTTWSYDGRKRGPLACYKAKGGQSVIVWADKPNNLLILAESSTLTNKEFIAWFEDQPVF